MRALYGDGVFMEDSGPANGLAVAIEIHRSWTSTYQWITIAGGIVSFGLAFMAGANDIPISFGAPVGSGVLTLRQSVVLAFVMEIVGASLLGNHSIDAIDSFILKERPSSELMMWGFLIAMIAAAIWLVLANYLEMPVTSILSIEGAIIGIALTTQGWHEIFWIKLVLAWLARKRLGLFDISSTASQLDGVISVTRESEGQETSGIEEKKELSPEELLKQFNELRVLHTVYEGDEEEAVDESPYATVKCSPVCGPGIPLTQLLSGTPNRLSFQKLKEPKKITLCQRIAKFAHKSREYTFDHKIEYGRKTVVQHALAEKFDKKVEELFSFLLILTASLLAIAHGSNNIPYVMAPYAGVLHIFRSHRKQPTSAISNTWKLDMWVRLLGGIGVSMGYGVCGWKLVRCLGGRLAFLSPSRAFSAQVCTLATIVLSTRMNFSVSTAHILVGAILGVSIADSVKNTNWHLLGIFILMWMLTLVLTCGIALGLYAFTIFSPSVLVVD